MSDQDRLRLGEKYFHEVYQDVVPMPPAELHDDFLRIMLKQLFAEVWSRPTMSIRDRRLVVIGMLAALGEAETFDIQIRTAIEHGEITREQVNEIIVLLPHYIGYPRASRMRGALQRSLGNLSPEGEAIASGS
jgi:4-carboxymuconolactone decarboxylase